MSTLYVRWMVRRDLVRVLEIERASFEDGWGEKEFLACLRQRACIGMVAERGDEIVGQMVYQLFPHKLELLTLAVDPQYRHEGVGTALLDKLKFKVQSHRRGKVVLAVREDNLAAQLFFRRCGLRATAIVPDGYRMEWAAPLEFQPFNFATRLTTCEN